MSPSGDGTTNSTDVLITMLRRMLRPLIRFLVARQIGYPLLSRVIKSLYVEVAAGDFPLEGKRMTMSRLSLLTGVHRREVKRIQTEQAPRDAKTPTSITLGTQIVSRWTGEAPWVDDDGTPKRLPRTSEPDGSPSFQQLVRSVSVDIHPRSVLDEWIRLGVASIDGNGSVVLNASAFVPVRGFEEKAHFVGRNLRDHLASACSNLADAESPFLERSVFYGCLPSEAIEELTTLANRVGQEALVRVNDRARELKCLAEEDGTVSEGGNRRVTFGVYLHHAPAEQVGMLESVAVDDGADGEGEPDA